MVIHTRLKYKVLLKHSNKRHKMCCLPYTVVMASYYVQYYNYVYETKYYSDTLTECCKSAQSVLVLNSRD